MKKKFNIIDVLIIAVLILAAAGVALFKISGLISKDKNEEDTKVIIFEMQERYEGFAEQIKVDEEVMELVDHDKLGTIEKVWKKPCVRNTFNRDNGETVNVIIPEREDVYIAIRVDEDADVSVGKGISVRTKQFTGRGYIIEIHEEENDGDNK